MSKSRFPYLTWTNMLWYFSGWRGSRFEHKIRPTVLKLIDWVNYFLEPRSLRYNSVFGYLSYQRSWGMLGKVSSNFVTNLRLPTSLYFSLVVGVLKYYYPASEIKFKIVTTASYVLEKACIAKAKFLWEVRGICKLPSTLCS